MHIESFIYNKINIFCSRIIIIMSSIKELRLVLIGDQGVGKSSLCNTFVNDRFSVSYNPTEEEFYRQRLCLNGTTVTLDIRDVNLNSQNFTQCILDSDGFMFIYDITNKSSFDKLIEIHSQVVQITPLQFLPQILIGSKSDRHEIREISFDLGFRTACEWGCKFFEVSAKNNSHIDLAFTECANCMRKGDSILNQPKKCCELL